MATQSTHIEVPPNVESPLAKLVYLALTAGGAATVEELQDALSMTKLTLYGVLRTLTERGLVEEVEGRYAVSSCFSANGPS
jgi:DNA-binding IclR family transcriptional regulator